MTTSSYKPPEHQDNSWMRHVFWAGLIVGLLMIYLFFVSSCSTVREVVRYQRDTTYVERFRVDSVWRKDSVFVKEKGDTVYIYKEKVREKYKLIRDTVRLVKVDSVAVETVKEVKVEKPLSAWKSAKIGAFWWLVAALLALLIWTFRKPILNLIKLWI